MSIVLTIILFPFLKRLSIASEKLNSVSHDYSIVICLPSSNFPLEALTFHNPFQGTIQSYGNDLDGFLMSTIHELLDTRAKEAEQYVQRSKGAKLILKIAGDVRLNVATVEPEDHASATITAKEVIVSNELLENPHATINGKNNVIKDLIMSTKETEISKSVQSFETAEKRGDVSIKSHGVKGRLIVSRVRKMLLG